MELTSVLESGMGCYGTKSKSSFFLFHWNLSSFSSEKIRKKVYFSLAIKATNATLHFFCESVPTVQCQNQLHQITAGGI